jgi:hypothetical protein
MPKRNIPNLRSLKTDDLKLLKYMEEKGREIAKRYSIFFPCLSTNLSYQMTLS